MTRKILFLLLVCVAVGATTWAAVHFVRARRNQTVQSTSDATGPGKIDPEAWARAIERVKEVRIETTPGELVIPPELKHYSERYWFLATQVAEIEKYNVHTCQDFLDLAALIQRGEMVTVPEVTDSYVLYGVGQKADEAEFARYEADDLKANNEAKTKETESPQTSARDFEALNALSKNFSGRSYDLNNPSDRLALRLNMLRSLRPEALKILEEVAMAYQQQFGRPLPVSSLVRPEQYQRALYRVNRNAVLIESPPHSTGLAFDIDYRYMTAGEQTFVMAELARVKNQGRIEVIRERNANYHVFAFIHGARPGDDLITASLEKAKPPGLEANHAAAKPVKRRSQKRPRRRR